MSVGICNLEQRMDELRDAIEDANEKLKSFRLPESDRTSLEKSVIAMSTEHDALFQEYSREWLTHWLRKQL